MNPRLSILLPAMRGYDSVEAALDAWAMQTCRDRLEVLILCPDAPGSIRQEALQAGQVIVPVGRADLHEARAIGVRHATGDYIMLAEDHCLPDPDWARAILERLEEDWDAVGSVLRPGNRTSSWTEASFLIGYGEWMAPVSGGPTRVLCGWNGTIRASLLKQLDADLADELLVGAFLVRRLQQQGHRFYLEDRARMRHFDPPGWRFELFLLFVVGMGFGAMRTRQWILPARLLWVPAAPAIAFLHWKRAFVSFRRAGSQAGLRPAACIAAMALAGAWGLGEAVGSLVGVDRVSPHIWKTEVKPVPRDVVAQSTAREALTC
jgi:hypothetical protein